MRPGLDLPSSGRYPHLRKFLHDPTTLGVPVSNTFDKTVQALKDDPELAKKVKAANSPKERAEILTAAGVPVPTLEEVNARQATLADVSGAGGGTTSIWTQIF